jgi:hypothetical protein
VESKLEAHRIRTEEVRVGQARVLLPGFFEFDGFESEPGPSFFEALADTLEALFDPEAWDKQLYWHSYDSFVPADETPAPDSLTV